VPAAGGPARHQGDHDLRHEPDEPLALQDVEPAELGLVHGVGGLPLGILVAGPATDPLVAAGAEGPLAVLLARPVAGEEDAAHVAARARVLEDVEELVDGMRPERVQDVGAVERDPDRAVRLGPVVGQVAEVLEAGDVVPQLRVEDLADSVEGTHSLRLSATAGRP
jgi:hypothetical protein